MVIKVFLRFFVWIFCVILLILLIKEKFEAVAIYPVLGLVIISEYHLSGQISAMVAAVITIFIGFFLIILYQGDYPVISRAVFFVQAALMWGIFVGLSVADSKAMKKKGFYIEQIEDIETDITEVQDEIEKLPREISKLTDQKESFSRFSWIATHLSEILEAEQLLKQVNEMGKELIGRGNLIFSPDGAGADTPARYSIDRNIPVLVRDASIEARIYGKLEYKSSITYPVETNTDICGFIQIRDNKEFIDDDLRLFSIFGGLVTLAFTSSLLYKKVMDLAITDSLTGLYVQSFFRERLEEEFKRARSHNIPLSLVMFDIDFFKQINDNYGHQCGDEILKQLGSMMRKRSRTMDVVARYGGEEFAVILVQTEQSGAVSFAQEFRGAVAREIFAVQPQGDGILQKVFRIKTTISAGIAAMKDENEFSQLIANADAALYQAKRAGRNRVEVHS
ncbi:MAG: GGDEF domain-containing protein [Elusimicrobiota bacterium]